MQYGFKIWSLCSCEGASLKFEPYCGTSSKIEDRWVGQDRNVVMDLAKKQKLTEGSDVF